MDFSKLQGAIAEAAEHTDMNEAQSGGGGERRIPEAGLTRLRLITYIETGIHHDEKYKKDKNEVTLQFELSGPKHPPLELDDGRKIPLVITINETIYLNEKANFFKLFKRMNHTGEHKHMAQMLGKEFLGTVVIVTKGEGQEKRTFANLRDAGGYTIRPPYHEDLDGNSTKVEVQAPLNPLKCFLWDYCDKEQWDSIFIDGRWDDTKDDAGNVTKEGRSKNFYQEKIKAAKNFAGSPIAELLFSGGADALELGEGEKPARTEENMEASKDAKAGAPTDPLEAVA